MKSNKEKKGLKPAPLFISMERVREVMQCGMTKAYKLLKEARDFKDITKRKHVTFEEFAEFMEISVEQLYSRLNITKDAA
ncbi:hypothetical protein AAU57_12855 [Nonlabens sp. YIK11]|uniref:hypothetical protein n=1 Tax=Nonlabens sp. YIK11 TaxID=1453349 RepID=UPI0006DC5681|nr:hypothetical protein [Nonlabens sp. YIK11]KQC34123.1 hypothetical protein AAU57_12855 [Nonlabens sp. YIK11]